MHVDFSRDELHRQTRETRGSHAVDVVSHRTVPTSSNWPYFDAVHNLNSLLLLFPDSHQTFKVLGH